MQSLRAALVVTFLVDSGDLDVARAVLYNTARTRLPRGFGDSAPAPPPPAVMHQRQNKRDRTEYDQIRYQKNRTAKLAYQNDYNAKKAKKRKTEPRAPRASPIPWTTAEVAQLATYLVTPAAFNVLTKRMCWKGVEAAVPTKTRVQCQNMFDTESSNRERLRALVKAAHPTA